MSKITAPFTPEQVEQLNRFQQLGITHPFTCATPKKHKPAHPALRTPVHDVLIATTEGWKCPICDYTKNWAHAFMADKEMIDKMELKNLEFRELVKNSKLFKKK